MPFAGFKDWDACMAEMKQKYDEETAKKVCGKLKSEFEKMVRAYGVPKNDVERAMEHYNLSYDEAKRKLESGEITLPPRGTGLNKIMNVTNITWDELRKEDRYFCGWGQVEVIDSQGEMMSIDKMKKLMPIIMKRGGVIMDSHSNRHVGKLDEYTFGIDPKTQKEGVRLCGHIFSDYSVDNDVWKAIQTGAYKGFSLGGRPFKKKLVYNEKDGVYRKVDDYEVYEWSVVRNPANPAATFDKITGGMSKLGEQILSYGREHGMEMLKSDDMVQSCKTCAGLVSELEDRGIDQDDALKLLQLEIDKTIGEELLKGESMSDKKTKKKDDKKQEVPAGEPAAEPELSEKELLMQILSKLDQIIGEKQAPPVEEEPPEETPEVPEETPAEPAAEALADVQEAAVAVAEAGAKVEEAAETIEEAIERKVDDLLKEKLKKAGIKPATTPKPKDDAKSTDKLLKEMSPQELKKGEFTLDELSTKVQEARKLTEVI